MVGIRGILFPTFAGRGALFWLFLCLTSVLTMNEAGAASRFDLSAFKWAVSSAGPLLSGPRIFRVHGSHCEWRMGHDDRVGYAHNHRHMEACADQSPEEVSSEPSTFDRHDKRTSTRKTAEERERDSGKRRRDGLRDGPSTKDGPLSKDEGGPARYNDRTGRDDRTGDEGRVRGDDLRAGYDDGPSKADSRRAESRERPHCEAGGRFPRRECVEEAPAPYRRDAHGPAPHGEDYKQSYGRGRYDSRGDDHREGDSRDELERPVCGVMCILRRAKFGYCGSGCSYYRRWSENDGGYDGFYSRRHRRSRGGEGYGAPYEPEPLK
jgi:hypothetical protein